MLNVPERTHNVKKWRIKSPPLESSVLVHDYTEPVNTEQFLNIVQLLWEYAAKSAATPEITTNPWYVAHLKQRETAPGSWLSPEAAKQAANTTAEKFTLWLSTTLARMAIQSFSTSSPVYFFSRGKVGGKGSRKAGKEANRGGWRLLSCLCVVWP